MSRRISKGEGVFWSTWILVAVVLTVLKGV